MATQTYEQWFCWRDNITVGNITNSIGFATGHSATVNITLGIGELPLATRYDLAVQNFLAYYLGTSERPSSFDGRVADLPREV